MRICPFIRPAELKRLSAQIPAENVKRDECTISERPRRVITRPERLIETFN